MDDKDNDWQDSDFEDGETSTEPSYVLIAIDTDKSMFKNYKDSEPTPFRATLNVCYNILDSVALSSQRSIKSPVGIALADNDAKKSNLVELDEPVPDALKLLKKTNDQSEDELGSNFERKGNFDLADFFLLCKNKLMNVKTKAYNKTVIYVTCDDNPLGNDPKRRFKVFNESQTFASIKIKLIVVTFNPKFEEKTFYSEVLEASKSEPVEKVNSSHLKQKLSYLIRKKTYQKRVQFYPFNGNFERYMEVNVSKPVVSNKVMKMHVTRDSQEEVVPFEKKGEPGNYKCSYKKNEIVIINKDERKIMGETSVPIGYTLLYVGKPTLPPSWVLTPSYLMKKHSNQTGELFEIFWQFCRDNEKCLVCLQKLKRAGNVRYVELIPKLINNVRQFLVKMLPFAPEIFYDLPKERQNDTIEPVQENAMSNLIDSLTIDYKVDNFEDPVEGRRNSYIKSQLLEETWEEIDDGVLSDSEIDKRIAPYIEILSLDSVPTQKRERKTDYSRSRKK